VRESAGAREPAELVEELSEQKARAVLEELAGRRAFTAEAELTGAKAHAEPGVSEGGESEDILVIGADTVVAIDGKILGKPADEETAAEMLRELSGREHRVYTGVTLLYDSPASGKEVQKKVFHEMTKVFFFPMSEKEIGEYVHSRDPMDKAGAYGIQGFCARYIRGIEGDYNNVVGLPVGRLYQELKGFLGGLGV